MGILTSHSMEEAEALCTRIGIVVDGRLRCLGSSQRLKNVYGRGYTIQLKSQMNNIPEVTNFVQDVFPTATLQEEQGALRTYEVPRGTSSLGEMFGAVLDFAKSLPRLEYAVSQTSLEQVFLIFGKQQRGVVHGEDREE